MKDLTQDEAKDCINLCECGGKPKLMLNVKQYWYICPICRNESEPTRTISDAVINWNKENKKK